MNIHTVSMVSYIDLSSELMEHAKYQGWKNVGFGEKV